MMNILYLASDIIASDCLIELAQGPHELSAVVTQPDRPAGRGKKLKPTAIKQLAQQLGLKVLTIENVNTPQALEQIRQLKPDILVTFAFNQKLGKELLSIAPDGAVNVHPSLLPKYRGAAPVATALLNGDTQTGLSIINMIEQLDAGDILAQRRYEIDPQDTTQTLQERLGQLAAPLLTDVLSQIQAGTANPCPQDHSQATLAPKMTKAQALLDFHLPAVELLNRIRAFTPWPGAFAFFLGQSRPKPERVVITCASAKQLDSTPPPESNISPEPGTILPDLSIQCGQGLLDIQKIKPAGAKQMTWHDFVNGRRVQPGDKLTDRGA